MVDRYVLIIETKSEGPLVMETSLLASDYEAVHNRMREFQSRPDVVRVAMARLLFETGNRSLLRGGEE